MVETMQATLSRWQEGGRWLRTNGIDDRGLIEDEDEN
jgi:hypothetical protein